MLATRLDEEIERKLDLFVSTEVMEIRDRNKIFNPAELKVFERLWGDEFIADYYRLGPLYSVARKHGIVGECKEIFQEINSKRAGCKILDAGCGMGTQSILFGMMGARVIGIDLIREELELAKKRKTFYESVLNEEMKIEFFNGDIFRMVESINCDIIWLREAISHIHPVEKFLTVAAKAVNGGGRIFINEMNWLHPLTRYRIYKLFWNHHGNFSYFTHKKHRDPETGQGVEMAEERLFTYTKIKKMLRQSGFDDVAVRHFHFLPKTFLSSVFPNDVNGRVYNVCCSLDAVIGAVPICNRLLGLKNIVIGQK
jgi:2-polyprenyl-3-methyl-5-hydroxy-6-metoxy-1,4-benzoquinol methylase